MYHKYKQLKGIIFNLQLKLKKRFRRLIGKKNYYVIGDSHSQCFLYEAFNCYHVGPATAFNLLKEKSTTKSKQKIFSFMDKIYQNKPREVIFVFGEIDARIHVNKVVMKNKLSLDKVIDATIKNYIAFLVLLKKKYPLINVYVYNILPSGEEKNIYNTPFYASREKRLIIARKMNLVLKNSCQKNNFKFIDIFDQLIDNNGNRIKKYVFDDVHYNRKIMKFVLAELESSK